MNAYVLLLFAIAAEIMATSALKISNGFSRLVPSVVVILGYSAAFWLMSLTLKTLPVSVVYAIWSGLGIIGITFIGVWLFNETFGWWHLLGTFFILLGVTVLSLITQTH
jgi:multidrug transporter EmrE-like cation transporter